jgi:ADP-ribosyl-[dinitrogen reductase] hydrolase
MVSGNEFGMLCRYENDFEKGVLANTNVGGENCHRGAAIGALLGARNGDSRIPTWMKEGLHDSAAIKAEIDAFVTSLQTCHA